MEVDLPTPTPPYTILRIKRKRTDEPLDALVIESRVRRKKSKGGVDLFQFATTVEQDAWSDAKRTRDLQDRISALARERAKKNEQEQQKLQPAALPVSTPVSVPRDGAARQYTIIQEEKSSRRFPTAPPKVWSSTELEKAKSDFKMYDAVLALDAPAAPVDEEMEKFLPMLQDYLKIHDIDPSSGPSSTSMTSSTSNDLPAADPVPPTDDPDYVWDIFYHRAGLDNDEIKAVNIATLTGLPASFSDPYSSDSDTEPEDDADEDSNAEEFYRNDYPEDEESDWDSDNGDSFHEHSDYDDLSHRDDFNSGEHDWR
ncbi:hypothetical protein OF83DRAFT_262772 [Amylostereum chailletii]|nr:hypothetical protein OF83DRAFT_262772 [Amylostereum chailletii]